METALRDELINSIPELNNAIYPTNAPETYVKPYLVYARISTRKTKTLEGTQNDDGLSYMFSIMATKYADMKSLTKKIEDLLITFPHKKIGTKEIYIKDLTINNIDEQYEFNLGVNRGIIDFTIYN